MANGMEEKSKRGGWPFHRYSYSRNYLTQAPVISKLTPPSPPPPTTFQIPIHKVTLENDLKKLRR